MGHRPVASTYDKAWVGRVLDAVDASVVVVDSRFVVEVWNEGTEQLYGWSAAEALGKPVVELIPPGQFEEGWSAESALDHALKHSVWQGEVVQTARDGTEFAANVMFRPITDEQDDIVAKLEAVVAPRDPDAAAPLDRGDDESLRHLDVLEALILAQRANRDLATLVPHIARGHGAVFATDGSGHLLGGDSQGGQAL